MTRRLWKVVTKLSAEGVHRFYEDAANRYGWLVTHSDGNWLELDRGAEQLIVFTSRRADGTTDVWYILRSP